MPLSSFQLGAAVAEKGGQKRLVFEDMNLYREFVNGKGIGERLIVTFEDESEKRSSAANRFLWGPVYGMVEQETGSPKDVTHDAMCERFLTRQVFYTERKTGRSVETYVRGGSSGLTPKQFHEFVEKVKLYFQEEHGITFEDSLDYQAERTEVMKGKHRAA